jgi:hypothetical protein
MYKWLETYCFIVMSVGEYAVDALVLNPDRVPGVSSSARRYNALMEGREQYDGEVVVVGLAA